MRNFKPASPEGMSPNPNPIPNQSDNSKIPPRPGDGDASGLQPHSIDGDTLAFLDEATFPDAEPDAPQGGEEVFAEGEAYRVLGKDEFFDVFRALIAAPNFLMLAKGQPALSSLEIAPKDDGARAASDALYDTCLEVSWLRWMIEPTNVYMQRALAVGVFGAGLAAGVGAELRERRKAQAAAVGEPGAAAGREAPRDPGGPVPVDMSPLNAAAA